MDGTTAAMRTARQEEQEKDLVTFRHGSRRRLWSTTAIGFALFLATQFGVAEVPYGLMAGLFVGALVLNQLLTAIATSPATYRWWMRYVFAAFDVSLISAIVLTFGNAGLVAIYFLALIPYSFDRGMAIGYFTVLLSAAGFVAASWGHQRLFPAPGDSMTWTLLIAVMLLVISLQVIPIPARLIRRIRATREKMTQAEHGNLMVRAEARSRDELGFLERSFNSMLEELGEIIGTVQREAEDVASYAERVTAAARELDRAGSDFASAAQSLSAELESQRTHTQAGSQQTVGALQSAGRVHERTSEMEADARALSDAATSSRDAIGRAATTLVRIGERVRESSSTVEALADASVKIGEFVDAVSRIARQTNLLALNAAIEAARAGEHGKGFAVVADEVSKLADESARAAREIAVTVSTVRDNIGASVTTMADGARHVRDVGGVATEANAALSRMLEGIARIASISSETAGVSRVQAETMSTLAGTIRSVEALALDAEGRAQGASRAAAANTESLRSLLETSRQLAELADRLRRSMSRFAVKAQPNTREMRHPRGGPLGPGASTPPPASPAD